MNQHQLAGRILDLTTFCSKRRGQVVREGHDTVLGTDNELRQQVIDLIESGDDESESESEYESEAFCDHCDKYTMHTIYDSGHERDSSNDWRKCHGCDWRWSGRTGRYEP